MGKGEMTYKHVGVLQVDKGMVRDGVKMSSGEGLAVSRAHYSEKFRMGSVIGNPVS